MKTNIIIWTILLAFAAVSCIQDEDLATPNDPINSTGTSSGSWIITYYWDSDHEETDHFTGYLFSFEDGGILMAANGTNTYAGTWSEGHDDSTAKLILFFSNPSDFEELSDDWDILEWNDSVIRLRDVSGGNGGTDVLHFEKI
jgi:hypothetical protein